MQRQEINQDAPARNILRRRGSPLDEEEQPPQRRHRNNREDPQDFEIPNPEYEVQEIKGFDGNRHSVPSTINRTFKPMDLDKNRRFPRKVGTHILITYTEDVSQDVIKIAKKLKRQGHIVNTDLHKESFVSAKNQGLVSERDQYTWLRNRFNHADCIIICSSKGYIEAVNLDDKVYPSPHYLNAKYIFELIMQDPRKSEKTIEICFENTYVKDKLCLPFNTRKFILPNEMASLSDQIRR